MTAEQWAIVVLIPPATFGVTVAMESWARWLRAGRKVRHYQQQAEQASRDRHPTVYDNDCGRPNCGVCELHRRRHG